ncbi:MAG: NAD(P)-binding domain-containing protein [Bacilli bacterium]|nr:NAD(P)-binding domain-containing protein [Bacilli bacterium]
MKVFCLNKISPVGLKVLPKEYEVSTESIDNADAVMVRSAAMHEMKLPESVVCVARAGAGVNNIPLDVYAEEGVVVFNTPGANANAVKELTIAMMLLAARDIRGSMEWVKENKGDELINKSMEKAKGAFAGTEIMGKTLGIIGCGAIGALVADAASKLGMRVLGVEPSEATIERNKELLKDTKIVSMDEMVKEADYISVHVPLMDATKGMINAAFLAKAKDGVIIVNAARDALVNDDDMKEALASGKVRRYVTDFPNYKSANTDGVVAISHLGASTEEAEDNCAAMAAKEIVDFIENGNIINSVNYPRIDLGPRAGRRMVVLHKAELNANEILKTVGELKNIFKSATGVKGAYAATVIEYEPKEGIDQCAKKAVKALPGVIRVRGIC